MELFRAGPARELWQLVVGAVEDVEADVALLDTLEALVHVALPHDQAIQDGSVLMLE